MSFASMADVNTIKCLFLLFIYSSRTPKLPAADGGRGPSYLPPLAGNTLGRTSLDSQLARPVS